MLENSAILCKKPANPDFTKELQLKAQLQQISDRSSLIKQNIILLNCEKQILFLTGASSWLSALPLKLPQQTRI